ncbi:MAG: alpha/beta hydrolase [Betaproteobacteria bacterium]|nr:alpha/beta hydrolase [Betaproteobacteria bacterium]
MTGISSTKVSLQGVDLEVRRKGRGPAMLVLHGGGGPVTGFPFSDKLGEHFELIEPVHPGFAGSKIPEHFDNLDDLVYLYLDLMDLLDLKDAVVLGSSMGGWTAVEIAVRNSQRIGKLILVDSIGIKAGDRYTRDRADVFALPPAEVVKLTWHDPSRAPDLSKMSDEQLQILASNRVALSMYTWDPYMHNPKLRYRLHRIKVPTLFIWGESDGLVSPEYGKAFSALIPGSKLQVIPKAGHAPHVEQPEFFVEKVLAFASKTGKPAGERA